ncbi:hypothetical protein [Streptomyces radicis]|uniref:Secreted protein n=1 Tax=Streptomyces radicis TaxID=1750517 RepID=A0A3A9WSP9_9ACTN|nr:hypothetical protein [Streptomyces radicis]RKN12584.1 hypothetical protein D7319_01090 [Streptomyces radicis]RKN27652.1 hypothetical protein D7318_01805 [Streptomyces radicis]
MNKWVRWPVLAVATAGAAALGAGAATADEHYNGETHVGSRFALVGTGQIDDPFEDVLEHAAILGSTSTVDSETAAPEAAEEPEAEAAESGGTAGGSAEP